MAKLLLAMQLVFPYYLTYTCNNRWVILIDWQELINVVVLIFYIITLLSLKSLPGTYAGL